MSEEVIQLQQLVARLAALNSGLNEARTAAEGAFDGLGIPPAVDGSFLGRVQLLPGHVGRLECGAFRTGVRRRSPSGARITT